MYEKQGDKLKIYRKKTGLSIFKIAKKIGVSGNYISMIERGVRKPSEAILHSLSEIYDVNAMQLFEMYSIIPTKELELLIRKSPQLKKLLSQFSIDSRFSEEEKSDIINTIDEDLRKILSSKSERR